jgi:glycine reductase complex component B subunit gamma
VLAQEIERTGIPTAQVCALTLVAESTGSNRIVPGVSVLHPTGNPSLDTDGERALRRELLERALAIVSQPVAARP